MKTLNFTTYPFIDEDFCPKRLIAAVLVSRNHRFIKIETTQIQTLKILLSPAIQEVFLANDSSLIYSQPMTESDLKLIKSQISFIREIKSSWYSLFSLPIRFRYISTPGVISCSSPSYPQHIFLDREAFKSFEELREQLLHEFCHNWLYLFQEVVPLTFVQKNVRFTLPSGTANRTAEEVLGAAYVAASLIAFYSSSLDSKWFENKQISIRRIVDLSNYLEICINKLDSLNNSRLLAPVGISLFMRINQILQSVTNTKNYL